jgi:acyl-CoA synthetase
VTAFFDCKQISTVLDQEEQNIVLIGSPISNCEVSLVTGDELSGKGEISTSGACLFTGYLVDPMTSNYPEGSEVLAYYRTGDFIQRLKTCKLSFLGIKYQIV